MRFQRSSSFAFPYIYTHKNDVRRKSGSRTNHAKRQFSGTKGIKDAGPTCRLLIRTCSDAMAAVSMSETQDLYIHGKFS